MEEQRQRQDPSKPMEGEDTSTNTTATTAAATPGTAGGEDALLMNAMYPSMGVFFLVFFFLYH